MAGSSKYIEYIFIIIILIILLPRLPGLINSLGSTIKSAFGQFNVGAAQQTIPTTKPTTKRDEEDDEDESGDVDVSGEGACACITVNGKQTCEGDCEGVSTGGGGGTNIMVSGKGACACANGICKGDCSDGAMIDPENFDPFEWVQAHMN